MVDIPNDVDLVDYDGDDEENPEEDPKEDPEEEPEPNNGLVNQFSPYVDPHQPGVMIEPPNVDSSDSVSSDSELEDEEADVAPEDTFGTITQRPYIVHDFPRGVPITIRKKRGEILVQIWDTLSMFLGDVLESEGDYMHLMGWNKRFYMERVCIGTVHKPPSNDEGTERQRKKSKKSSSDGTEGPSEPRGTNTSDFLVE
ncbi:hypothetical protein Tco_1312546 [Tanacetum coccineum]